MPLNRKRLSFEGGGRCHSGSVRSLLTLLFCPHCSLGNDAEIRMGMLFLFYFSTEGGKKGRPKPGIECFFFFCLRRVSAEVVYDGTECFIWKLAKVPVVARVDINIKAGM